MCRKNERLTVFMPSRYFFDEGINGGRFDKSIQLSHRFNAQNITYVARYQLVLVIPKQAIGLMIAVQYLTARS